MVEIPISKIIQVDEPSKFKFHAARWNGYDQPLDVYVRNKKEWFEWNAWRNNKNEFSREYIFSLIDFYPEKDTWLFGGIYKVLKRNNVPMAHSYEIEGLTEYSPYIGRLKVKLKKPPRGRAFYLENYLNKMKVSEILKQPYSGALFPGYENINHDFNILAPIFENQKSDWKAALENVKGVYVIMDKNTGKAYVGSAYGESGIWSRWSCYIDTGHGGNEELIKVIKKESLDYSRNNFRLSLLEYRSMKVDDKIIQDRERYWKEVFISRGQFGYNKN